MRTYDVVTINTEVKIPFETDVKKKKTFNTGCGSTATKIYLE